MVTLLLRLLRLLPLLCGAHRHVALENLALRHQLAVYKRTVTRPKVRRSDRLFWVALSRVWAAWRQALVIVSPNTVLRWQRRRFCEPRHGSQPSHLVAFIVSSPAGVASIRSNLRVVPVNTSNARVLKSGAPLPEILLPDRKSVV